MAFASPVHGSLIANITQTVRERESLLLSCPCEATIKINNNSHNTRNNSTRNNSTTNNKTTSNVDSCSIYTKKELLKGLLVGMAITLMFLVIFMTTMVSAYAAGLSNSISLSISTTNDTDIPDVAYIYKSSNMIDYNVINLINSSMNLSVELLNQNNLSSNTTNLSKYLFIIMSDETFTRNIPVSIYPSVVTNSWMVDNWGLTDSEGTSILSSAMPLTARVLSTGNLTTVYNRAKTTRGSYISYYFLSNSNKVSGFQPIAVTPNMTSGPHKEGDVVSFLPEGSLLENGNISQAGICFYGILASTYWTQSAKDLFITCAEDVMKECNDNTDCDDGLWCNGYETCNNFVCQQGTPVNCSTFSLPKIEKCNNTPDNNTFTLDFAAPFTSACNEAADSCTMQNYTYIHTCAIAECNAECETNTNCNATECDNLDGCVGLNYYDYTDVSNTCLNNCSCTRNSCSLPFVTINDSRCFQCLNDTACNSYDNDYCLGDFIKHDEGKCVNYTCVKNTTVTQNCSQLNSNYVDCGITDWTCSNTSGSPQCILDNVITNESKCADFCSGDLIKDSYCNSTTFKCDASTIRDCNALNYTSCNGTSIYSNDYKCQNIGVNATLNLTCVLNTSAFVNNCNDTLFCNGQETCSNASGNASCISGTQVNCSTFSLAAIATCSNIPDNNTLTWDYAPSFLSACNETLDSCSQSNYTYTHTCSKLNCSAECESNADCNATDCDYRDGCVGNDYYDYIDAPNSCLNNCSCTRTSCTTYNVYNISYNDSRCIPTGCQNNSDCDYLDDDFCNSSVVSHKEGVCVNRTCTAAINSTENCSARNGLHNQCGIMQWSCGEVQQMPQCLIINILPNSSYCSNACSGNEVYTQICNSTSFNCQKASLVEDCDNRVNYVCNGTKIQKNDYTCSNASCTPNGSIIMQDCNDNLFCNGQETCQNTSNTTASCAYGTSVNCSSYNQQEISTCNNNPDNNVFTLDFSSSFTSQCNETSDSCNQLTNRTYMHSCSQATCNATCDDNSDCASTACNDGCVGEDYYDYGSNVANSCLSNCSCTQNSCSTPTIYYDDIRCANNTKDDDCDYINDLWEAAYGFPSGDSTLPSNITDLDSDGRSDYQEGLDGTKPNVSDTFGISTMYYFGGKLVLKVPTFPWNYYSIQSTSNLVNWTEVTTFYGASNATYTLVYITIIPTVKSYRVKSLPIILADCHECDSNADCDDGIFCNGQETCNSYYLCQNGTRNCSDSISCTLDSCNDATDSCTHTANNSACNDGLYCNGEETCNAALGCMNGTTISCSFYNLPAVNMCYYNPDNNPYTFDSATAFTSACNESTDSCTIGCADCISHMCSKVNCNAQCETNLDCNATDCDYRDGCIGDHYYDYTDVANACFGNCSCSMNTCGLPTIYYNDSRCTQCQNNSQCSNLTRDYCFNSAAYHDEGRCQNYRCVVNTTIVQDCNIYDSTFCNSTQVWTSDGYCSNASCIVNRTMQTECNDGLYCNGNETCQNGTCKNATAVDCSIFNLQTIAKCNNNPDNNVYTWDYAASFTSTCNETSDRCTQSNYTYIHTCSKANCSAQCDSTNGCNATDCDYRDGCIGDDYYDYLDVANTCLGNCSCTANICGVPTIYYNDSRCTQCQNNSQCTFLNREYCNGTDIMKDSGVCVNYRCYVNTTLSRNCDDSLWCNGAETCANTSNTTALCYFGTSINCTSYNLPVIGRCNNAPDSNAFTWDYAVGFISTCNDTTDSCTQSNYTYTHTCSKTNCSAQCEVNADCSPTECDQHDGCVGLDYYNYTDVANSCFGNCSCQNNSCSAPVITINSPLCGNCLNDTACDHLDLDYCSGTAILHREGKCVNYSCTGNISYVQDCRDSFFCNGNETCSNGACVQPANLTCNDGVSCTTDSCSETLDSCINTPQNSVCDDGLWCNGAETCSATSGCLNGTSVDCSTYSFSNITTCTNIPDSNSYTWDYSAGFNSVCNDTTDSCTRSNRTYTHTCNQPTCGALCDENSDCTYTECDGNDRCIGPDYYDYNDMNNICLGNCSCSSNTCTNYTISRNDSRCVQCIVDSDCASLQANYCYSDTIVNITARCINYNCSTTLTLYNCSDSLWCNGAETCNNSSGTAMCLNASTRNCSDGISCTADSCNEVSDSCSNVVNNSLCDDGLWCNGAETCSAILGCQNGTTVDCSLYTYSTINTCTNVPDSNSYTWDYSAGFTSVCNDTTDSCTRSNRTYTHTCNQSICGATCDSANNCTNTECDGNDQCIGPDYYDYNDMNNTCLGNCSCTSNTCTNYTISRNDSRCVNCLTDSDCASLQVPYCSGTLLVNVTAKCINYNCSITTNSTNCSDTLWCNGAETCSNSSGTAACIGATAVNCSDSISCTIDSCNETSDSCSHTANNSVCNDNLWCNGNETCNVSSGCQNGTTVDCTIFNLATIGTCSNVPDSNSFTWDYAAGFTSACNEATDSCSQSSYSYTHTCSKTNCSAECESSSDCSGSSCSSTYTDYCSSLTLVEYDTDKVLDSTTVSASCNASCLSNCSCNSCTASCAAPATNTYCVYGVCGAACDSNDDCGNSSCSATYTDYCNGLKLVEYDSDQVLDSTTVTNTCSKSCLGNCSCGSCTPSCSAPTTSAYCVYGTCSAVCDATHSCTSTDCDVYDGCSGTTYYDYHDMANSCQNNCSCTRNSCTSYTTYAGDSRCYTAVCGNGIIDSSAGEQCDDGNTASSDGCSSTCRTESLCSYNCNPYNCNPYDCNGYSCNPHDCNCHQYCHFGTCVEVCDTCYDTCYQTCYQTCYDTCYYWC